MAAEDQVKLMFTGRNARLPLVVTANTALFEVGEVVQFEDREDSYLVVEKRIIIGETRGQLTVTLKSTHRWTETVESVLEKYDSLMFVVIMTLTVAMAAPLIALVWFLSQGPDVQLAVAGKAIVWAPLIPFIGVFYLGLVRMRKFGILSVAVMVPGLFIAFGLWLYWRYRFVPKLPVMWPADYANLASSFWHSVSNVLATGAMYLAVMPLILKALRMDFIGGIAELLLKRKSE
jgi:hypothetical protein